MLVIPSLLSFCLARAYVWEEGEKIYVPLFSSIELFFKFPPLKSYIMHVTCFSLVFFFKRNLVHKRMLAVRGNTFLKKKV